MYVPDDLKAGDQAHCATECTVDGVLTDPTTIKFRWQLNDGAVTEYTGVGANIKTSGTGLFYVDLPLSAGKYDVAFVCTGAVVGVDDATFTVAPLAV